MVRPNTFPAHCRRWLPAILLCLCGSSLWAQKSASRDYLVELDGLTEPRHEKLVRSAFNEQDPNALVSMDMALQFAKVRIGLALDAGVLAQRLALYNITVVRITQLGHSLPTMRSSTDPLPGFPIRIDTGDPAADDADYQARKEAWIAAHPGLYPNAPAHAAPVEER